MSNLNPSTNLHSVQTLELNYYQRFINANLYLSWNNPCVWPSQTQQHKPMKRLLNNKSSLVVMIYDAPFKLNIVNKLYHINHIYCTFIVKSR